MSEPNRFEEKEYSSKFDVKVWKKIFRFGSALFPIIGGLVIIMIGVAILDGVFPQMTRYAIDTLIPALGTPGMEGRIAAFVLRYGLLALLQGFNVWALIMVAGIIEVRLCYILRDRAFHRLQELSFSYFDRTPAGWIIARLTSDAQKLGDTIAWGIVDLVWGTTMMLTIIVFMLVMHPQLALITLVFVPPLLVVTFWFQKRILEAQRKSRKANSIVTGVFTEGLQGGRTSKALGIEQYNIREFSEKTTTLRNHAIRAARLSALYLPMVIFLAATGAALALGVGGRFLLNGSITVGTLVAFLNYAMMFFDPAREVARVLSEFQAAQASAERLIGLIETEPEIVDRPRAVASSRVVGELVLDRISFRYNKEGPWIFRDFSLTIPAGQTLAVVGETGCGKSTLVNLICRFYEPEEGSILIDGLDYRQRTQHWLHSQLGYVLQTPLLFSGTVKDNIRYGKLDATDEEIYRAARDANALGFIERLEQGFDTPVGEGGALLSIGQKQLISIARVLVADPRIIILDEATSSVDTETEMLIQKAIGRLLAGRTSIVIAHRLSTIRTADRIIVLDKGRIVEDGNHAELMSRRGTYWKLYTQQFLDEGAFLEASGA
ncbi:MAG TPA: ABC transporter ATP-binding protein [Termitinemataceae bacterium]|nr:ABC transporter ATP-binding protein [Termitinemataceae bacterium]HPQ01645.1 ABC transporter ATP-binding protein [Termitinemataceae bacterium]